MFRKLTIVALLTLLSIGLIACSSQQEADDMLKLDKAPADIVEVPEITEEPEAIEQMVTEDELMDEETLVLIVNDEEVHGDRYNLVYYQTKNTLMQEADESVDLAEIHEKTIEALIRQTIFVQDAYERGIVVTDNEAEAIYQDTKAQFDSEEEFYHILDQLPYTKEVFQDILAKSLLEQYYIDQEFSDISVSKNDVDSFYEILQEQMEEEPPPLADIRAEIESRLLQTEIQIALNDRINQLLLDAEIERFD